MTAPSNSPHYIVSTDLDGTLLDHHSYSWEAALPSLKRLQALQVPVVINTSKTFEEVCELQKAMQLRAPFVVENGSALYLPVSSSDNIQPANALLLGEHWQITLGKERAVIVDILQRLREDHHYQFSSFSDMSLQQVIDLTSLRQAGAQQALNRKFSEPLVWNDSAERYQTFINAVTSYNLRVIKGGRFIHILGQTDKGLAVQCLKQHLETINGDAFTMIALGDSPNDVDMLNIADIAVLVRSPAHDYPELNTRAKIIKTKGFGPVGWHEAITQIIEE